MIPNRAPAQKTHDLTMLRYQQMPMIPPHASNNEQRRIASSTPHKSSSQSLPKKIGRPKNPPVVKLPNPHKRAGETLSAGHKIRIEKQVAELFKHGPLTVVMIQRALKLSIYQSAGRKVFDWKNRGLIMEVKGPAIEGDGRAQQAKWWGLRNAGAQATAREK